MNFESIIKNGKIVLEGAQAINFLLQSIKIFISKLKSLSFNKTVIDDFNDDKWFTKFSKVVVDENVITDLLSDFKQPTDINKFKISLKNYFCELVKSEEDADLMTGLFLTSVYDSMTDKEKASLSLIIDKNDEIEKLLKEIQRNSIDIKSIDEIELELKNNLKEDAEIKEFDLRYFFIDDKNFRTKFDDFLDNRKEINVATYSIEEGIYCILNYLRYEKNIENAYVINNEETWNNLNESYIDNTILIANFFARNNYKKYKNSKQIFIFNKQSQIISGDIIELRKRTIPKLHKFLTEIYNFEHDEVERFLRETNGNYYLVKKRLYTLVENKYDEYIDKNKFVALLLANRFSNNEFSKKYIKNVFSLDIDNIIDDIQNSDLFRNNFKIVNRYGNISISVLDAISLWGKYDFFEDKKVEEEIKRACDSISRNYELKDCGVYIGFICSLAIYKSLNLFTENYILPKFVNDILLKIKDENDWNYLISILPYMIEIAPDLIIERFLDEFNGKKNTGFVNIFKEKKEYNLYIKYLWIIEKSLYLVDNKKLPVEVLFAILQKKFDYKMNNPIDILRKLVFPGIESPLKLEQTKQIFDALIKEYSQVDVWDIFYSNVNNGIAFSWSKPEIADYDDNYVNNVNETYMYCFNMLLDLPKNSKNVIEIIQLIMRNYNDISDFIERLDEEINKQKDLGDMNKFYIKYELYELIYNYRYFNNDGVWKTNKKSLEFIDNEINEIIFDDDSYEHLLVFQNEHNYNLIMPKKYKTENSFETNIELAKKYKDDYFKRNDIDVARVISCYKGLINNKNIKINQYAFQLSYDLAEYFDKRQFNIKTFKLLLNEFIADEIFHKEILDYIWALNNKNIVNVVIAEYKNNNVKNDNFYIRLLDILFRINQDISFLDEEDEKIIEKFWDKFDYNFINDEKLMDKVLDKLCTYKNFSCYINVIYHNKDKIGAKKIITLLKCITDLENSNDSYYLSDILDNLYKNHIDELGEDVENFVILSNIELHILDKFHYCNYKFTQFLYQKYPDRYVDYVYINDYRLDEGNQNKLIDKVLRYNGFRYRLNLNSLSAEEFLNWDKKFKSKLKQNISDETLYNEIYYDYMGSIIGLSENDKDGAFPLKHFRQFIEDNYGNKHLCDRIIQTKYSKRGMYTPMQGEYNYNVASFINSCIEKCHEYPMTVKMLKKLREQFLYDAKSERELSENENF